MRVMKKKMSRARRTGWWKITRSPSRHSRARRRQAEAASCSTESWRFARPCSVRMDAISAAATTNETASMIVTASNPPVATITPASTGPISLARWLFSPFSALAVTRSSSGFSSRLGRRACSAGWKSCSRQLMPNSTTYATQMPSASIASSGRIADRQDQVDDHHQALPVPSVHEHAGDRAEGDRGDQEGEHHGAGGEGRAGAPVDLERQPHDQDPVADHRDEAAEPEAGEVGLAEDAEHRPIIMAGPMDGPMPALPPGYTARPVKPDTDIEALLDLSSAAAIAEYGVPDMDERMMRGAYRLPAFEPERDSLLVAGCRWAARPARRVLRRRGHPHLAVLLLPRPAGTALGRDRPPPRLGRVAGAAEPAHSRPRVRGWRSTPTPRR